jgi:hypothetical protein
MSTRRILLTTILGVLLAFLLVTVPFSPRVFAALQSTYAIPWWTLDGGGGTSTAGDFTLFGTIGQPAAGDALSGGDFTVQSGFWAGAHKLHNVYVPLVLK